ncbi:DUF3450 domain-containing protein [Flavobacterium psychrophilum]|uniref:hypothetical protein n=1 Tax=Flavobacterium psychrophilum TaxID=96345 RepID=UPI000B7C29DC|nr:hypothetical protein [Flavobacterium psychrophilum]QZL01577.1 DUF3450 domain-containing protein [Flavobacterium psychrophilum]SNA77964.1 probable transmembrane hypothetical protein [Flavobacterium psychrophilum]SNB20375.1 conserved hypothetical protein [Flavobacterium psychrophilum]SNB33920.1 conserved hypothetical protein [Flavobacterium psychrophilum]
MIKDFLISFTDNFKEKTKNPFLGTYLFVWLIRNWDLAYTLFNFDKDCTLDDKKTFISNYYKNGDFISNLGGNILWAFGILITTYLLLNISRLIVNLSERRLTPWIYQITDSKSIVLKSEYERIRAESDDLQLRLDKERESKSRLEARIKSLEAEIIEITRVKTENVIENIPEKKTTRSVKKENTDSTSILIDKIIQKELLTDFLNTCTKINKGDSIPNSYKHSDYFTELGLIKFFKNAINDSKIYSITSEGEILLKKIRLLK